MMGRALVIICLLVSHMVSQRAFAQQAERETDWLRALPTCALGADAFVSGPTKLLYPRPGLPALVRPGALLVTRVRLPTPLTPPPGYQQEKALRGWSVELLGRGFVVGGEHRYELRVSDVRPDADEGLVYRASIRIPPWVAPGVYDLRLQGPWAGHDVAVASVRVLGDGPIRIGSLGFGESVEAVDRLAFEPIDVWIQDTQAASRALRAPLRGHGLVWLARDHAGALFRDDEQVVALGGCSDRFASFPELTQRYASGLDPIDLPEAAASGAYFDGRRARRYADLVPIGLEENGRVGGLQADGSVELSLVLPDDGLATRIESARVLGFWPSTPPRAPGHLPGVVVRLAFDGQATYSRGQGELSLRAESPARSVAGHPSTLVASFDGAAAAFIAWSWGEDETAFHRAQGGRDEQRIAFRQMRRQPVHLWAVSDEGVVARTALAVNVETDRPPAGCQVGSGPAPRFFGLLALACYGWRRRPRNSSSE